MAVPLAALATHPTANAWPCWRARKAARGPRVRIPMPERLALARKQYYPQDSRSAANKRADRAPPDDRESRDCGSQKECRALRAPQPVPCDVREFDKERRIFSN